jgi:HPt (histidine-containing phosphotransfer) domain-containing protein
MEQLTASLSPLDQEYLRINFHEAGFSYLLPEILKLFQGQVSVYLTNIEQSFQHGNLQRLSAEAHSLKGSAGSVGATALAAVAEFLEQHAESADNTVLRDRLAQLQQTAKQTDDAIIVELANLAVKNDEFLNLL